MSVIKHKHIFLILSGALVLGSLILIAVFGLKQGIDLKGGAEWQIYAESLKNGYDAELAIKEILKTSDQNLSVTVKKSENNAFIIRLPETDETKHAIYLALLQRQYSDLKEISFYNIGPSIGGELKRQSIQGLLFVLLGISLYIAWAFRKVSKPVSSWKYGASTLITLFHDVAIPTGLMAFLGYFMGIEIDTNFIVALLVVMGFSVHDTIVVFDRIRENIHNNTTGRDFGMVIDQSIKETVMRSINTSLTLILVLITLLVWGPAPLFYFILIILIGTVFGTYSSICVASPLLYLMKGKNT